MNKEDIKNKTTYLKRIHLKVLKTKGGEPCQSKGTWKTLNIQVLIDDDSYKLTCSWEQTLDLCGAAVTEIESLGKGKNKQTRKLKEE